MPVSKHKPTTSSPEGSTLESSSILPEQEELVVLQKSERNAVGAQSRIPAQLSQPLQTGWR